MQAAYNLNRGIVLFLAAMLLVAFPIIAQQAAKPAAQASAPFDPAAHNLPASANDLVREVISNQLKQAANLAYMYHLRKESPSGVQTREVIETRDGNLAWVLTNNDQPLSDDQRQKEDGKLQNILKSPEEQAKRRKDQKEDDERTNKMLQAMPEAFIYAYDGTEPAASRAGELVRLTFRPNPDFKPPDRETQVYRGMEGHMLIDPVERHMVKIDANLFRDVNFGWGIFGHLDKGGHFMVAQSRINKGRWDTTDMILDFTGKVLLFKKLRIKEREIATDFRPVPHNLSLEEGAQMLRQTATQLAQKKQF